MNPLSTEEVLKFFEQNIGAQFVDVDTGQPVLDIIENQKARIVPRGSDDYDKWLAKQDEDTQLEHKMGEI